MYYTEYERAEKNGEMEEYRKLRDAQDLIQQKHEWHKWVMEIPYISFPAEWEVRVIPPFGGTIARFWVRPKGNEKIHCSVFLDCYNVWLPPEAPNEPYWEVHPHHGTSSFCCKMHDTEALINAIRESFGQQREGE